MRSGYPWLIIRPAGDVMTIDQICDDMSQLASDINEALPSDKQRADFRERWDAIEETDAGEMAIAILLRLSWQARGGAVLAGRTYQLQEQLLKLRESERPRIDRIKFR